MKILQEFKDFAIKGNAIDMAVGIVIGAAFGKIVASLVSDVIMPPIGLVTGGVDFSEHKIVLKEALGDAAAVTLNWGLLANNVLNFIIVAFAIFMVVKGMNKLKRQQAAAPQAPAAPPADVQLLTEIRDLLKKK